MVGAWNGDCFETLCQLQIDKSVVKQFILNQYISERYRERRVYNQITLKYR